MLVNIARVYSLSLWPFTRRITSFLRIKNSSAGSFYSPTPGQDSWWWDSHYNIISPSKFPKEYIILPTRFEYRDTSCKWRKVCWFERAFWIGKICQNLRRYKRKLVWLPVTDLKITILQEIDESNINIEVAVHRNQTYCLEIQQLVELQPDKRI